MKNYIIILILGTLFLPAKTLKIMPVGDSITYDNNHNDSVHPRKVGQRHAYRNFLYYKLKTKNIQFHFVGSVKSGQDIIPYFDPYNEGYPGEDSFYIAKNIYRFLTLNPPDIILLHIGTNDHNRGNVNGMKRIFQEVDRFEKDNIHPVRIIVALIIQRQNRGDLTIEAFNNNLAVLTHDLINQGDNIIVVDMENDAGLTENDYADGTHPNNYGYNKMAQLWVEPILKKRNDKLYLFPLTLANRNNISNVTVSEKTSSISFTVNLSKKILQF